MLARAPTPARMQTQWDDSPIEHLAQIDAIALPKSIPPLAEASRTCSQPPWELRGGFAPAKFDDASSLALAPGSVGAVPGKVGGKVLP